MTCVLMIPGQQFTSDSFVFNETPIGANNCSNLFYATAYPFISDTIKIRIDGKNIDPIDYQIGPDNQSFTLVLDPTNSDRLNRPLRANESLKIDYIKKPASGCVISL